MKEKKQQEIINLQEWNAAKTREIFGNIATEIRNGTLQLHFGDNTFLFAKTEEILHFALEGETQTLGSTDYQKTYTTATQEILRTIDGLDEALSRYPSNDCPSVRQSIEKIKSLAQQIKL
ncbi:MAG: hypothetical protein HQ536_01625 [Parcubacteria group bacterium]|nr:hypothetical protein [Parcubacteria group bacterium]